MAENIMEKMEKETKEKRRKKEIEEISNIKFDIEIEGLEENKREKKSNIVKRNKTAIKTTETKERKKRKTKAEKEQEENEIKMHTEEELTEISLHANKYKIELQESEYDVYTKKDATSYIIVKTPKLRIVVNGIYVLLEKREEEYFITTNQDFKTNYMTDNLERRNNTVNFKLTDLTEIEAYEEGLMFKVDEEKIIESNLKDNNTLVISEEDEKIYLPYTKEEIKDKVAQNVGMNVTEVIEKKYIVPLSKYKNSMKARFREGYNLMYKKENKSRKSAFMLGIELMFEFNLHPAIISACKNLEELDIYLDCLEDNELEKFSCFKIIYKSLPTLTKSKKINEY